jgi:hypothetical protein
MSLLQDKLLMEDGNKWLYKNKEHGMLSATASIGLVLLWDVDGGNILQYVEVFFILVGFVRAARTRLFSSLTRKAVRCGHRSFDVVLFSLPKKLFFVWDSNSGHPLNGSSSCGKAPVAPEIRTRDARPHPGPLDLEGLIENLVWNLDMAGKS